MKTQLINEVKNYVMVFHDSSYKFITAKQAEYILEQNGSIKGMQIDGCYITLSSIAKLLPINEFYDQYPDKQPEYRKEFVFDAQENYLSLDEQLKFNEERKYKFLQGLNEFIENKKKQGEEALEARKILEKFKLKYGTTISVCQLSNQDLEKSYCSV